jgi:tetratricopeptide (TPR) repeat protein
MHASPSGTLAENIAAAEAALWRGDSAAALAAAQAARRQALAAAAGPPWLAQACVFEAVASQCLFDYPAAFERALEALALLDEQPADEQQAAPQVALRSRALNTCFIVCAESGDLDRALDFSRQAVALAEAGDDPNGAARAMHNRGTLLGHLGEYEAARHCLRDAVARYEAVPQRVAYGWFARVALALNCLQHAHQLAETGRPRAARARRRLAARVVPPLLPADAGQPNHAELHALDMWIIVRSELGHLAAARQGLRRYLRMVRLAGRAPRFQAYATGALAAWCFHGGRTARGIRLQQAAVARLARAGNQIQQLNAQQELARMQAAAGLHSDALDTLRIVQALRTRMAVEQAAMRCRLAVLQRQAQQRAAQQQEARTHQRRLAAIGRLLAEIHLALDEPLRDVHAALQSCEGAVPPQRSHALRQVIGQIDAAAGLVRQLRMFVYRGAPQAAVVGLHKAVRDAWAGIAAWRRAPAPGIAIAGALGVQAQVDGQRLAVLLHILLMEAERAGAGAALQVRLEQDRHTSRVELCAPGLPRPGPGAAGSIGLALCREIVQEIGGELVFREPPSERPGVLLELPGA